MNPIGIQFMVPRPRTIYICTTIFILAIAAWYVFLVVEPFKPPGISYGATEEGKPWNTSEVGQPFEGARLILQYYDVYDMDEGPPASHNWLYQVLIVFPKDSPAEHRGTGLGTFGAHTKGEELGLRPRWRFRFDEGEDQRVSIELLCKEIDGQRWMLIENERFQLRQGNLFCVFLNQDMKFKNAIQLNETINRKATIADFKQRLPDNDAVQAIRIIEPETEPSPTGKANG